MAATWLFGLTLRAPLFTVPIDSVRTSGLSREVDPTVATVLQLAGAAAGITVAYLAAAWALHRGFRGSFAAAIAGAVVVSAAVLPQMPFFSPDTVHFAADVRTFWIHHEYPSTRAGVPNRQDDPIAREVRTYRTRPSAYGPVAYAVGGAPIPFTGGDVRAAVFGQKLLSGALLIGIAAVAGLIAGRTGRNRALTAGLIGLNPLMLLQFPGDGHNDTIMVFFAMAALFFVVAAGWRRRAWAVPAAAGAALSKFSILVAAPMVAAYWLPRWRPWLAALFLAGAAGSLAALILVRGYGANGPLIGVTENTPYWVSFQLFEPDRFGRRAMVVSAYLGLFVVTAAIMAFHRLKTPGDFLAALGLQLFLFLFLFAPTMRHWYQVWAFPFAILAGTRWLRAAAIAFSAGAFIPILARNFSGVLIEELGINRPQEMSILLLWALVIGVAVTAWLTAPSATPEVDEAAAATPPVPREADGSA